VSPPGAWTSSALDPRALAELVPPATLTEARAHRDALTLLLGREREAAADFLLGLADFDRRRGWERLGHASLFAFLTRELGLSKGGAFFRLTAARLVVRFPEVLEPLRDGRLCVTSVVELSRVITPKNRGEVLPRFFGCSSREAKEVAAALDPRPDPPQRAVVTTLPAVAPTLLDERPRPTLLELAPCPPPPPTEFPATTASARTDPAMAIPEVAEVQSTEPRPARPASAPRTEVEPLTAELRRLHVTVSARFLEKVAAARDGLSHSLPGATTEQVLEAALDLLLEKQARSKALVKRPRARSTTATTPSAGPPPDLRRIPAAVEREVRLRDGSRCQYPLDSGGVCGSTWQVELDHVVPVALGGPSTVANLRCACRSHNRRASELLLGEVVMARQRGSHPFRSLEPK